VAPQLNGIFTLIGQQAGGRLGQLQPQLYGAYNRLGYGAGSPFRAITTGTNVFYSATNSYNPATGLGVLNIDNLAAQLAPQ
jgi:subtilase family serine protease